jgi:hypothetical protein
LLGVDATRFERLKDSAEPVGGLSGFLEKYIGECPAAARSQCRSSASAFRGRARSKRFYMLVREESASSLSIGSFDSAKGEFTLQVTPFFSSGPYALSHGAPKRTDAGGNPQLPFLVLRAKAPEDWNAARLQRLIASRELRLEVIFTPEDVWTLARKRGGKIYGVKTRFQALQVTSGRTGEVLALWEAR